MRTCMQICKYACVYYVCMYERIYAWQFKMTFQYEKFYVCMYVGLFIYFNCTWHLLSTSRHLQNWWSMLHWRMAATFLHSCIHRLAHPRKWQKAQRPGSDIWINNCSSSRDWLNRPLKFPVLSSFARLTKFRNNHNNNNNNGEQFFIYRCWIPDAANCTIYDGDDDDEVKDDDE